jgi:hypothetical protein
MKYIIDEEILKSILNYLISKPYAEVYQGVEALKMLKVLEEKVEEKEK